MFLGIVDGSRNHRRVAMGYRSVLSTLVCYSSTVEYVTADMTLSVRACVSLCVCGMCGLVFNGC